MAADGFPDLPDIVGKLDRIVRDKRFWNGAILGVIAAWLIVFLASVLVGPTTVGQVGDSFGIINGLASVLTLLGVFYTVMLQREEIEGARQEARKSEEARLKSERLLESQAQSLRAAAELNAINSLLEDTPRGQVDDQHLSGGKFVTGVTQRNVLNQRLRIVLNRVSNPHVKDLTDNASDIRRYLVCLVRGARGRLEASSGDAATGLATRLIAHLMLEFRLLAAQEGIHGTSDSHIVDNAIGHLEKIEGSPESERAMQLKLALGHIEGMARSWGVDPTTGRLIF